MVLQFSFLIYILNIVHTRVRCLEISLPIRARNCLEISIGQKASPWRNSQCFTLITVYLQMSTLCLMESPAPPMFSHRPRRGPWRRVYAVSRAFIVTTGEYSLTAANAF